LGGSTQIKISKSEQQTSMSGDARKPLTPTMGSIVKTSVRPTSCEGKPADCLQMAGTHVKRTWPPSEARRPLPSRYLIA